MSQYNLVISRAVRLVAALRHKLAIIHISVTTFGHVSAQHMGNLVEAELEALGDGVARKSTMPVRISPR